MELNERIKAARKALSLTQKEFAERLGVTDGAISFLEKGERNLTDQMLLCICREFPINEEWLRGGVGEMFVENDNTIIAALTSEYGLSEIEQKIFTSYLALPEQKRAVIAEFVASLGAAIEEEKIGDFISEIINEATHAGLRGEDYKDFIDGVEDARSKVFGWISPERPDESAEIAPEAPFTMPRSAAVPYADNMEASEELTEDEAVALVKQRYAAAKKGTPSSTTSERLDYSKRA